MTQASLSNLKVIDLSRVLAGPLCAMLLGDLGDLGADVIKVERPDRGDVATQLLSKPWLPISSGS